MPKAFVNMRILILLGVGIGLAVGFAGAEEGAGEGETAEDAPLTSGPLEIPSTDHPYVLPNGAGRGGWERLVKNDFAGAEEALRAAREKAPADLEVLEGLRAVCMATGRYKDAQDLNLQMIRAAGDSPCATVFLRRAMESLPYVESRKELLEALDESVDKASPSIRLLMRDLQAILLSQAERFQEAQKKLDGLGYVDRWLFVAGPFGRTDRNNTMDRRFAPERPLKELQFADEQGKPVTVRKDLPVSFRELELGLLFPQAQGVFYACTNLESDRDQNVILVPMTVAGSRIYLRGLPILLDRDEQYPRQPPLLQVRLLKGPNLLMAKLPMAGSLSVRLLSGDFGPVQGVRVAPVAADVLAAQEIIPVRGFVFSSQRSGMLAESLLKGKKDEVSLSDLAREPSRTVAHAVWLEFAAREENDLAAREAIARNLLSSFPDSLALLDTVAAVLDDVGRDAGYTEARFEEEARRVRERALGILPTSHQHLLGMARFFQAHQLKEQAFEKYKACVDAHPESAFAQQRLGEMYQEQGLLVQAEACFERAAKLDQAWLPSLGRFCTVNGNRVRAREIDEQLRAAGRLQPIGLFQDALLEGDLDKAAAILDEQEKLQPDRIDQFRQFRIDLAVEREDLQTAYALQQKTVELQPGNRAGWIQLAEFALRLKKDAEAREALTRWLKEHPGDFEIRRRLRDLNGHGGERWWEAYDVKVDQIDTSAFTQAAYPRSNHAWIVDFMVVKVLPDYSRESYVHIAQKVLNQEGINELSEVLVHAQQEDMVFIRTLNPDGSSYQPQNVHDFNLARSASFLKVAPGSILEHAYLEHEDADEIEPRLDMAFNFMALDAPRAVSRWIVMLPKDLPVTIRKVCPDLIEEKILPGPEGYIVYQWTNKQVEGVKVEPFMPSESDREVIPLVFVEAPERPFRATGWLTQRQRLFLPAGAVEQARAIAGKFEHDEERFAAIVEWVRTHIQSGRETQTLEDVWALRSGNTGQMADLAQAMCQAVQLPVRTALANRNYLLSDHWVGKNDPYFWEPAAFAAFGGAGRFLVLEPQDGPDRWVQFAGNPQYTPPEVLMDSQPGALALTLGEEGIRVKRVAGEKLGLVPADARARVTLDEQGGAVVHGVLRFNGILAARLRQVLADPRRSSQVKQGIVQRLWPRMEVGDLRVLGQQDIRALLRLEYDGSLASHAAAAGRSFFLRPFPQPATPLQMQGPAERVHDILIKPDLSDSLSELNAYWSYEVPPGFGWVEVPDDLYLCNEFGFYLADFNVTGRTLTCNRSYLIASQRITPEKYPAFQAFLRGMAALEQQRIAYAKLDYPGLAGQPKPVLSMGYANHVSEEAKKNGR